MQSSRPIHRERITRGGSAGRAAARLWCGADRVGFVELQAHADEAAQGGNGVDGGVERLVALSLPARAKRVGEIGSLGEFACSSGVVRRDHLERRPQHFADLLEPNAERIIEQVRVTVRCLDLGVAKKLADHRQTHAAGNQ